VKIVDFHIFKKLYTGMSKNLYIGVLQKKMINAKDVPL
jgi:hypothetical protein